MNLFDKKEIFILGMKHKVVLFNPSGRKDDAMGRSDCKQGEISLCNNMPKDITEQTCLHEIIHLIDMNLSLGLKESQVLALAAGLYSVIKENKL